MTLTKRRVSMEPMSHATSLPVDLILPEILASLRQYANLVIEAAPGAGKTTRVPQALLSLVRGDVVVLEPRRIAARLAARRVAWELGEDVGETVGYQVRFDEVAGPRTRLRFVTEGILTRRMLSDPSLKGVDVVVLDEFHERHLDSDLALALLKRLQVQRPELHIVVMSATLETAPVARFLSHCPIVRSEGRLFEVAIQHLPYSAEPLHVQVGHAAERLLRQKHTGHTLIFLPGAAEIRRAMQACSPLASRHERLLLPLHGDLSAAEQDLAIQPSARPKLIFATNVAESSITVEGVTAVIDSGLARMATYSPWTGLPTLHVSRVSQASAKQRAGRAGRTGPGRVLRLYAEEDFHQRAEYDSPEIVRSELSQLGLALRIMGIADFNKLEWLDAPPEAAVHQAESLLDRLGASGAMAVELARYPLPPRLARILVESMRRGVGEQGCAAVAMLGSGARAEENDLLAALEAPQDERTQQQLQQLKRIARPGKQTLHDDDALLMAVLTGFPDRVARRRAGDQITLATGLSAEVYGPPTNYEFMVAVDAEDRRDKALPLVRMTARIEPEWLIDMFPERLTERSTLKWHRTGERVESVSVMLYDELVIHESRHVPQDVEVTAVLLSQKAMEAGIERFVDRDALALFEARVLFAGLEPPDIAGALQALATGLKSFSELKIAAAGLLAMLEQQAGTKQLQQLAPVHVRLQGGRQAKIHYEQHKPPWISSRLQDFFGMHETPRIGPQQTPLVVHLLAPNQRAVQTTTDLAGFWERLYPTVRRELMRRYPRHAWPERP